MKLSRITTLFAAILVSACYSLEIGTDTELLQSGGTEESDDALETDSGTSSLSGSAGIGCTDSADDGDTDSASCTCTCTDSNDANNTDTTTYDRTDCMATFYAWQDGKVFPGELCVFGNEGCGRDPEGLWCLDGVLQMYCNADSDYDSPDALIDSDDTCPVSNSTR